MVPATAPLIGFSGKIIWPLGQISLLVKIGDEEHSTSAWMNFVIVRSSSSYNGFIGRPGPGGNILSSLNARCLSCGAGWDRYERGSYDPTIRIAILTTLLKSSKIIPIECAAVSGPEGQPSSVKQTIEERIKVAINPKYLEQTIMFGSTLSEKGQNKLCDLLQRNLDVFAWKPANMTGIPRNIAEHQLNVREGCPPVRQKERSQAPDRNQAIQEEVEKLVDAGIMKEVHYHNWLSNPVMVKKYDGSWRMCVDFKDLNKACPKDGYPLPKIDWKVESLCGFPFKCFLDGYKGYHQIKMAKEDEEKNTFITSQGIFCYSKMPFGLRNVGATYQRLVDKAFHKQIGMNLEVYVDDLVVKSRTEDEIIRDIEETFKTLREINMKLHPKKYTFGVEEGMFLGYKVNTKGIKVCPNKVDAVLSLPSPKCLKDVQKLNGKLASLNMFLAKSAEKSLPFFKILKKYTNKSDFHWTGEVKSVFKQMKHLIAKLPMLTAPEEKEELIVYLALAKEAVSAVLMTKREGKQLPIYFVSRALRGPEVNYTSMEKLVLALTESSMKSTKWSIELGKYVIHYRPRVSVKGQILADFIVEHPEEDSPDTLMEVEEELLEPWILFTDGTIKDSGTNGRKKPPRKCGLAISGQLGPWNLHSKGSRHDPIPGKEETLPAEVNEAKAVRRKSQRFAVVNGVLYNKSFLGPWLRSVVAKALRTGYYWPTMHKDARTLIRACQDCQCEKLCIRQRFASVKHPQANGLVERANRSLGEGIKARLEARSKNWMEEISHVLWAHRTMIKSSNGDTPFSLTYGTKAVIPAEIGMPTLRTSEVDMVQNNKALEINLDLLEEMREQAAIRKAGSNPRGKKQSKNEKILQLKGPNTSFKPEDLVYRSHDASRTEEVGKLGPKWEGPYEVTKALGKGVYKLRDRDGKQLPRTWNIRNLKKCYVHEM
ncbi:reverse transcriptase domain-containing protein, partial [Tanacetum coccineum]